MCLCFTVIIAFSYGLLLYLYDTRAAVTNLFNLGHRPLQSHGLLHVDPNLAPAFDVLTCIGHISQVGHHYHLGLLLRSLCVGGP